MVTVTKEIANNVGGWSQFTKMNVIQQEALAKSVGLSSDQLSDMSMKQEMMGKSKKELLALGENELVQRLESQTIQDKFEASMIKLKALFTDLVTAILPIVQPFMDVLNIVGKIINFLSPIMGTITGIASGFAIGGPLGALIGGVIGAGSDIHRNINNDDDDILVQNNSDVQSVNDGIAPSHLS